MRVVALVAVAAALVTGCTGPGAATPGAATPGAATPGAPPASSGVLVVDAGFVRDSAALKSLNTAFQDLNDQWNANQGGTFTERCYRLDADEVYSRLTVRYAGPTSPYEVNRWEVSNSV